MMTKEQARTQADDAIRQAWLALRDLSDFGDDAINEEDLDVWDAVTQHRAIQDRLRIKVYEKKF